MTNEQRAKTIVARNGEPLRYKILTLEQIGRWREWRDPGRESGQEWGNGERVYAFEDGSVYFVDSGYPLRQESATEADVVRWIDFLDGFRQKWECRTCAA
ncbi:MAG: hypothetical protein ABFD98_20375 [Syntrophobacteraceae bacterium]|nr:hypothetical protein [Desulfobacteraceae bacterium]